MGVGWVTSYPTSLLSEIQDSERPCLKDNVGQVVVAHSSNPSTWEAEAGGFLSLRPDWSTEWSTEFQDSQGYTEKPCLKKTNKQTNKQNKKSVEE